MGSETMDKGSLYCTGSSVSYCVGTREDLPTIILWNLNKILGSLTGQFLTVLLAETHTFLIYPAPQAALDVPFRKPLQTWQKVRASRSTDVRLIY